MTSEAAVMPIEDYLAKGGKLTSPDNVPPRYRAELLRMMSSFVDSELAGSAGFADAINWAPGISQRIAASRIVLEKAANAEKVLDLMKDFGTDKALYNRAHDWAARQPREASIDPRRQGADMRLSVFHSPLAGWTDACVMNLLMGLATGIQLRELAQISYIPFAEVIREIAPVEARHKDLGLIGLEDICASEEGRAEAARSVDYWLPRVAATFGAAESERFARLHRMGLRHSSNQALLDEWTSLAQTQLAALKLR
ncbi:Phenylacetic acid catabolic protein [uncultured Cohaesibacter sp.]|uniref:Phenylacetic acid catabolic protein n=1 Tax=uncultured Cohaesibacter sp. TaxID=1002546 RepID=UPI0029C975A5|nr:Phenylacetic acid catabolic protein [uncultured Cohaesibacter sp.]